MNTEQCPCGQVFQLLTPRKQGGGRYSKYCSVQCRARYWARQKNLRRHGLTERLFEAMLRRQNNACAGCLLPFAEKTPCIDHDHATGRVRGLLCMNCNLALGNFQDDPMIARRLMAYLDRDCSKTMVYLAGALKNKRIPEIGNLLRSHRYDVMDEWFTPGEHADTNWQEYEKLRGRSYKDALHGRSASNILMFDRAYIDMSDVLVVVMPAGKSAMLELGYAKGRGKKVVLFLDGEPERYDVMPRIVDYVATSEEELLDYLELVRVPEVNA